MAVFTGEIQNVALARELLASGKGRQFRQQCHLSLGEVAAALGVSAGLVAKWETGECRPRKAAALAYAQLLGELLEAFDVEAVDS
jgi:DNA-binding transcriptional regulator YiaG